MKRTRRPGVRKPRKKKRLVGISRTNCSVGLELSGNPADIGLPAAVEVPDDVPVRHPILKTGELDEMLRVAAESGKIEEVILLLEEEVNVDAADESGKTPLMCASAIGHVECVKLLLDWSAQVNLQDKDGVTSLMKASTSGNVEIMKMLLQKGANVNHPDKDGKTSLMYSSEYGHVQCIKMLLDMSAKINHQDDEGWTSLMFASQFGHLECLKELLDRGAEVNLKNMAGWTPLVYASTTGQVKCVAELLDRGAQANQQDNELLEAVRNRKANEVMKLIQIQVSTAKDPEEKLFRAVQGCRMDEIIGLLDAGVNIDAIYKNGYTSLMFASGLGHVDCVKLLLKRGARINYQNNMSAVPDQTKGGCTALHLAAMYNQFGCVKTLLSSPGIDVNIQDSKHQIALKYATKYDVLAVLQKYTINCEDYPIHSFGKAILCGDTGSGKTTLAQAVENFYEPSFLKEKSLGATHLGPVKLLTAGIVPHLIRNQDMNMMLFDLAGHRQYYSSHCAVLEAISLSPSTFLLLVNLLLNLKDITAQLYYWSAMIGDVCHKCPQHSSVIVVGTHADMIADSKMLDLYREAIENTVRDALNKQTFIGFTAVNATTSDKEELKSFMSLLRSTNDNVIASLPAISLNSHLMYAFLKDKLPAYMYQDAIPLSQLLTLLEREEPKCLPSDASAIVQLLKTLSGKGFIVFLEGNLVDSWVVIHPEALLEKVNGVLFAPPFFEQRRPISSNTGVIPVPLLKQHFIKQISNIDMVVQFLKLYELCVPITLTNVDTNMTPANSLSTDLGPLLFFPACISVDKPPSVIIKGKVFSWLIHTKSINQFFSTRCLHVLILRLADRFALPSADPSQIPTLDKYNRRCTVWSKGISWMNEKGISTVIDMMDNFRQLSCSIFPSHESLKYLLLVIGVIKDTIYEFCPSVCLVDLIPCPSEATNDDTHAIVELSLLVETLRKNENTLADSTGTHQVIVNQWIQVEPKLLDLIEIKNNAGDPVSNQFLKCNIYQEMPLYTELTGIPISQTFTATNMGNDIKKKIEAVSIIIQACNENELRASAEEMAQNGEIVQVVYDSNGLKLYLGVFGNCPCVLVVTGHGKNCKDCIRETLNICANASLVIGIGIAVGLHNAKLGDVLIATAIEHYDEGRIQDGNFVSYGEKIKITEKVQRVFALPDCSLWDFPCTKGGRKAKCIPGLIISIPYFVDSKDVVGSIVHHNSEAIGLEMEGHILQDIAKETHGLNVAIIKGVFDLASTKCAKINEWQYTAARAAAHYARRRLMNNPIFALSHNEAVGEKVGLRSSEVSIAGGDDFSNVSADPLGEDDLVDVFEEVIDMALMWKQLGLTLRLKNAELDSIQVSFMNPKDCMREMLLAWLRERYDVKRFGLPSWKLLCQCIQRPGGGNNPGLAREIAEKHICCLNKGLCATFI